MKFTRAEYIARINELLPDNATQLISPLDLRTSLIDLVDSVPNFFGEDDELCSSNFCTPVTRTTIAGETAIQNAGATGRVNVDNSAFGYFALGSNYSGTENTAVGSHALGCNMLGSHNVGVGFQSIGGNTIGSGNVAIGNYSLLTAKKGSFNIAIGHGAGYYIGESGNYQFYLGAHAINPSGADTCAIQSGVGPNPLLYGDLEFNRLSVAHKDSHVYGVLQVSGDITPALSGQDNLGNHWRPFQSVNEKIYFKDGNVGIGTGSPSGNQGLVTVKGSVVPQQHNVYALGHPELRWDGYFNDFSVSGVANINDLQYNTIEECLYECRVLHLATSGYQNPDFGQIESGPCGYLADEALEGAGLIIHSSGTDYKRDYSFLYSAPDASLECLESGGPFARAHWQSNISLRVLPGRHVQVDRILGDDRLALVTQSGCQGIFIQDSGNKAYTYISPENYTINDYGVSKNVNFIGRSGIHEDYGIMVGSTESGVISQSFYTRTSGVGPLGFTFNYEDNNLDSDRLNIVSESYGGSLVEAVSITRSGLFGISDIHLAPGSAVVPETILNVQASGDCNIRFSSAASGDNTSISLDLLGNGNGRGSGLSISYDVAQDSLAFSVGVDGTPIPNPIVSQFSLVRDSGVEGENVGFMSVARNGFLGMGTTQNSEGDQFDPIAPITVSHSGSLSGTIALKEQDSSASATADFGKIYVKPISAAGQTQALYFLDDGGNEFKLFRNPSNTEDNLLYGDSNGNTFGGYYTPDNRTDITVFRNTMIGHAAGFNLSTGGNDNTILGYTAASGLLAGDENTILGATNIISAGSNRNVIIGKGNVEVTTGGADLSINNCIMIGNEIKVDEDVPDYTLAIGYGDDILVEGNLSSIPDSREFSILDGKLTVESAAHAMYTFNSVEDGTKISSFYMSDELAATPSAQTTEAKFRFTYDNRANNLEFLTFNHQADAMSNTPTYSSPTTARPYAQLEGDMKLRGALRFADGTYLESAGSVSVVAGTGLYLDSAAEGTRLNLQFTQLTDADTLASDNGFTIDDQKSYVAVSVGDGDGIAGNYVGKITLESLGSYIGDGLAAVENNCNMVFSNEDVDTTNNSSSVFIGCDVGISATGWKHSVLLGSNAGQYATVNNAGLATDTAGVFIGYKTGRSSTNAENSIFIGNEAGALSSNADDTILIGNSAGISTKSNNSIGLGYHALRNVDGENNIEILAGLNDNQRLLYNPTRSYNNKLNINNTIAGDMRDRTVSIGDALLEPDAVLSVRKDDTITGHSEVNYVQTWYCNDNLVAYVDCNGDFGSGDGDATPSLQIYEGIMSEAIAQPASYGAPESGLMQFYNSSFALDGHIYVTSRDNTLTVGLGDYVIARKINGEYRPIWVSC